MATVVENLEQIQKEVVVEGSASSTKEVVQEHPQDENQAAQEERRLLTCILQTVSQNKACFVDRVLPLGVGKVL